MTAEDLILDAMRAAGCAPLRPRIVCDGAIHRDRDERDKAGSKNLWYVCHTSPHPHGAFGSWRTGETHTWAVQPDKPMSPAARSEQHRQVEDMRRQRHGEEAKIRAAARAKAARLWNLAKPPAAAHPYLAQKKVKAWGLRQLHDALVVPARDAAGQLHTLQFIGPDGAKRFLTGGRISGCYFAIGRPSETLLLAEGYATAATLFEATGHAVACAFNAGNLEPVAKALRAKFPDAALIICADDDRNTPGNPGLSRAQEAAWAVRGLVAVPDFKVAA